MQNNKGLQLKIIISVVLLLLAGHILAINVTSNKQTAWMYITAFYGAWLITSILFLVSVQDLKKAFSPTKNGQWNLLFVPVIALVVFFIFIPNIHLLRWNYWLLLNTIICLVNPFLEEIYWRGLVSKVGNRPLHSFLLSSVGFAASHPLLFGVVSPGVRGWVGFGGTFLVGALFWLCYYKTKSLWGCVINHFLIDVAGMAVFILADKAVLAPITN